jgi:CPA2 family monovalent cation:H+ antiporter-2
VKRDRTISSLRVTTDPLFFRDLSYVLIAAVAGGFVARALRQPLIVGFVLAGMVIGPFTPGPRVSDLHTFELFAEIGVVLLMFSIGIEFSLRDLLRVKWVALLGGPLGILLSIALAMAVGAALGWPPLQSAVIGIVTSVASTMVLAQLLLDRGELHSTHGRVMIGIALVEDLAVVVMTVLLPALGALEPGRLLAIGDALLRAAVVLVPFFYLAAKVVPRVMARIAATQSDELFLLVSLAIGLGTAAVTQAVGLSLALGAFLGGLLISGSDYAHETLARLLPLRDVFVALFFVTVGALIDPGSVLGNPTLLGAIVGLVVVGKLVIRALVVRLFGYPFSIALLTGVGLSQIGEFSFVLVQVARLAGHVGDDVYQAVLAASLLSVFINAGLERNAPDWIGKLRLRRAIPAQPIAPLPTRHVLLCGFGRVGSAIGEALETFGIPFEVVERDPDLIQELQRRRVPGLFGDAGNHTVLRHAGAASATLVIVALPQIRPAERAVRAVRALNPRVPLLARAHGRSEAEVLRRLGATEVIQPEMEASATLIRHALAALGLPKDAALHYLERFHGAMLTGRMDEEAAQDPLPVVHEVRLGHGALADRSLREARIRERFGVTVVAVTRPGGVVFNPAPETILRAGDLVRVFGLQSQIGAFTAFALGGPPAA